MNTSLFAFQEAFAAALRGEAGDFAPAAQPGFAIHRNTTAKAGIDALAANFPAVEQLTGRDWFRAAAARYMQLHPPADPRLWTYGDTFPDFLARLPATRELPYLAEVARLDRDWLDAHTAADAHALSAAALAGLSPQALGECVLPPHPATRWRWHAALPIFTLWSSARAPRLPAEPLSWHGEGVLLLRCDGQVQWHPLGHGDCAFLDGCAQRQTLAAAAAHALAADPALDLADTLARLLALGAFADLPFLPEPEPRSCT